MPKRIHLIEILILLLAFGLRTIHLNGSFWLDEAAQALESSRPLSQQLDISNDFQPPLFHLVIHSWTIFGREEWVMRLSSLVAGLITVLITIRLGKKLFTQKVGVTAGLFMATSQFHLFYSQELRPYSFAAMWAMICVYAYFSMVERKKNAFLWFVVSGLAGLYSMYVFPFLLIAILIVTIRYYPKELKKVILSLVIMGIGFLPWLPKFFEQLSIGTTWARDLPLWSRIVSPPLIKMLPLTLIKFMIGRVTIDPSFKDGLIIGLAGLIAVLGIIKLIKSKSGKLALMLCFLPILGAFIVSIWIPVLDPKRVLYCLPLLYIAIAAGIQKYARSSVLIIGLLVINFYGIYRYTFEPTEQREPWRQTVADIETVSSPNDLVVFAFDSPFAPWVWYRQKNITTISISNPQQDIHQLKEAVDTSAPARRIYVFDYLADVIDPHHQILELLNNLGYEETGFYQYPGIGKIHIFESINALASLK